MTNIVVDTNVIISAGSKRLGDRHRFVGKPKKRVARGKTKRPEASLKVVGHPL